MDKALDILIIDDNIDDRTLYKRALSEALGSLPQFEEAGTGEHGLESISKNSPSCVLLDYSLPGHNGIEVLKRIRAKHPYLPVIMLTGQGNETVAVRSMKEGAQDYIAKSSITSEMMERIIRASIGHCALEKRINEQRTSLEIFTRALAHDLKEPVRTIKSFIELIDKEKNSPEKVNEYFTYVKNAADRMSMLIDTVFQYTQLDSSEQLEMENCDVSQILTQVKENLGQLIQEHKANITSDELPSLPMNQAQMMQLLQNLIANAIHHSEDSVTIHVSAKKQEDNKWLFSVSDNGPGIAEDDLERIFVPFKRLMSKRKGGAGLGLAICRKIIDLHDGKIWCKSQPGSGAAFHFTLPA